jgi:chromosome segregation ATPase
MSHEDKRAELLSELTLLRERLDKLKKENEDLNALIEQISLENEDLKREVRERLEQTQMLRGLL